MGAYKSERWRQLPRTGSPRPARHTRGAGSAADRAAATSTRGAGKTHTAVARLGYFGSQFGEYALGDVGQLKLSSTRRNERASTVFGFTSPLNFGAIRRSSAASLIK